MDRSAKDQANSGESRDLAGASGYGADLQQSGNDRKRPRGVVWVELKNNKEINPVVCIALGGGHKTWRTAHVEFDGKRLVEKWALGQSVASMACAGKFPESQGDGWELRLAGGGFLPKPPKGVRAGHWR